ncbi:MAG: hypothetical protein K0U58_02740 [Gammaproteobacteria bacterium]|nr:hypothetical protein [Gammaproteobacteria bacterium]MCH9819743.1 hypothetical protein [Gammaproteobacteria bacterium]
MIHNLSGFRGCDFDSLIQTALFPSNLLSEDVIGFKVAVGRLPAVG